METKLKLQANFQSYCSWRREEHQQVLEVHPKGIIHNYFSNKYTRTLSYYHTVVRRLQERSTSCAYQRIR